MWYQDILSELKMVLKGNTLDALVPSLLFVILQNPLGLGGSAAVSVGSSLFITLYRVVRKQKKLYALLGVAGVLLAAGYAYFTGSAENYFLPRLVNGGVLFLFSLGTLVAGRPLAALLSHITRGWPLAWFLRKDVKPAYREVTLVWTALILFRLLVQFNLYRGGDLSRLLFVSTLMGTPATVVILVFSYVYGIFRLKKLKGPSVEEFLNKTPSPWQGQSKGF